MMNKPQNLLTMLVASALSTAAIADDNIELSLEWNSNYISEGRNNLDGGGIEWVGANYNTDYGITVFGVTGFADSENYVELNVGVEYGISPIDNLNFSIGVQRLEFYGDDRAHDNEIFAAVDYSFLSWLTADASYTFATEADGYFIELSLIGTWPLADNLNLSASITQGLDFQYVTEEHDGSNNFQFGLGLDYAFNDKLTITASVSHSIAQDDIEEEAGYSSSSLDETFGGVNFTWAF